MKNKSWDSRLAEISSLEKWLYPGIVFTVFIFSWQAVAMSGVYTPYQFPSPVDVWRSTLELYEQGTVLKHIRVSMYRLMAGFLLALAAGVPLGIILGWKTRLFSAFDPLIQIVRPISPIAWFPLAILWFKIGDPPAIFIIFMAALFPILLSAVAAVRSVPSFYLKVAVNFGAGQGQTILNVVLPAAFPQIMVGVRIALGSAWIHLVAGEMLGVQSGLGFLVVDARNFLRTDWVISAMILIGILGLLLDAVMAWIQRRIASSFGSPALKTGN